MDAPHAVQIRSPLDQFEQEALHKYRKVAFRGYQESAVAARFQRAECPKSPKNDTLKTCRHTFPDSLSLRK